MAYQYQLQTSILQTIPDSLSQIDAERVELAQTGSMQDQLPLFEELAERHHNHPYFLVRMAHMYTISGCLSTALDFYRQAQRKMLEDNIVDPSLNKLIENTASQADAKVREILDRSSQFAYYQRWVPTRGHKFPLSLPQAPEGHEILRQKWQALRTNASSGFSKYLTKLAIETNQVESTFLLTQGSTQDLMRHGIAEAFVVFSPESSLYDVYKIKSILNDTLAAYELVKPLLSNLDLLDHDAVCHMHARLMKTDRFLNNVLRIVAGKTRTFTWKTVIVGDSYMIECCPFPQVDEELDYILRMAKQWIANFRNPFATASWFHLALVRCHPFEDGNGRLVRLLASIPLMKHGYPPISIYLTQRSAYYGAINKAYQGDHKPMIECIMHGMQETIESVQNL